MDPASILEEFAELDNPRLNGWSNPRTRCEARCKYRLGRFQHVRSMNEEHYRFFAVRQSENFILKGSNRKQALGVRRFAQKVTKVQKLFLDAELLPSKPADTSPLWLRLCRAAGFCEISFLSHALTVSDVRRLPDELPRSVWLGERNLSDPRCASHVRYQSIGTCRYAGAGLPAWACKTAGCCRRRPRTTHFRYSLPRWRVWQ